VNVYGAWQCMKNDLAFKTSSCLLTCLTSTQSGTDPGAKFSKLLRKIFGRLLLQRKYADFWNFFGKCLWKNLRRSSKKDFEKGCAIFETSLETSYEEFRQTYKKAPNLSSEIRLNFACFCPWNFFGVCPPKFWTGIIK